MSFTDITPAKPCCSAQDAFEFGNRDGKMKMIRCDVCGSVWGKDRDVKGDTYWRKTNVIIATKPTSEWKREDTYDYPA